MPDPQRVVLSSDPRAGLPESSAPERVVLSSDPNAGLSGEGDDPSALSLAGTFLKRIGSNVVGGVKDTAISLMNPERRAPWAGPLTPLIEGMAKAHLATGKKAVDVARNATGWQDYPRAAALGLATLTPLVGPLMASGAEHALASKRAGNRTGMAEGAGDIATALLPLLAKSPKVPATATTRGVLRNPNILESQAFGDALSRGVPVDLGTAANSPMLKAASWLSKRTLGGELATRKATNVAPAAMATWLDDLKGRASKTPATPETAGAAVRSGLERRVNALHDVANQSYDAVRAEANAPSAAKTVVTGERVSPLVTAKGQPIMTPVTEQLQMPVNITGAKRALTPIYEGMVRQMPLTQQQASPALNAIKNIINSPDEISAVVLDRDLSALKSVSRGAGEATRDLSQGIAAKAVAALSQAVDAAVTQQSPAAMSSLARGRAATKAKWQTAELLDRIRTEPVGAFKQALAPGDAGIGLLRQLESSSPKGTPGVLLRGFLEDQFRTAVDKGGFDAKTLWQGWDRLGPQTKKILTRHDDGLAPALDRFTLAARRMADNPNPSGSAYVGFLATQGVMMLSNPLLGAAIQVPATVLARGMNNIKLVKALTQGMTVDLSPVRRAAAVSEAMLILGPMLKEHQLDQAGLNRPGASHPQR